MRLGVLLERITLVNKRKKFVLLSLLSALLSIILVYERADVKIKTDVVCFCIHVCFFLLTVGGAICERQRKLNTSFLLLPEPDCLSLSPVRHCLVTYTLSMYWMRGLRHRSAKTRIPSRVSCPRNGDHQYCSTRL